MKTKIKNIMISAILIVATTIIITGCATTPSVGADNSVKMEILDDNSFMIYGFVYPAKELPKRLKKMGANSQTEIYIQLPSNSTTNMMKSYGAMLKQNGFGRFIFSHEQKSTVTIKEK
ncbi:MAG: hypothetical protein PF692_01860 [Kiritimatiellae bacterium]|nr:hypothetical protein [Kiritimatiellia bacterium]